VYNKAKVGSELIQPGMSLEFDQKRCIIGAVFSVFHGQAPKQSKRSFFVLSNVDTKVCSKHDIDSLVNATNWDECSMSESELGTVTTKCISQFIEPHMSATGALDESEDDQDEVRCCDVY
jgi:hypothetical protein